MKVTTKTTIVCMICLFCIVKINAQDWNLNGNNSLSGPVPNRPTFSNNRIGTLNNSIPLNIITNGVIRMHIRDGGGGPTDGYVGIGNSFGNPTGIYAGLQPQQRLHLHDLNTVPVYTKWTNKIKINLSKIS